MQYILKYQGEGEIDVQKWCYTHPYPSRLLQKLYSSGQYYRDTGISGLLLISVTALA